MKRFISNVRYLIRKQFYPKSAEGQRNAIFKAINKAGEKGMTRDEVVVATGIPLQSVTWRVRELIKRDKTIVSSPYVFRPTRLGRFAEVMFAEAI